MLIDGDLYALKERCALYAKVVDWLCEQDSTNREALAEVQSGEDEDAGDEIVVIPDALQISEERVAALALGRLDQFSLDELKMLVTLVEFRKN